MIILVNLCGGVLYEGLFLTKQCKNNISEVLDQLTLLKMQKWLDAQCFGLIDLAERPDTTKQVCWNDQQVMKKYEKIDCWNC